MKTLKVNRSNWSGKEGEICIIGEHTFHVEDVDGFFRLTEKPIEGGKVYTVVDNLDEFAWRGYEFTDLYTKKTTVMFESSGVVREHSNPFVAFAQLAWSIY